MLIPVAIPPKQAVPCPVVTMMLKKGAENPVKEVSNLQQFLRDDEGLDVVVTGDFDDQTEAAVKQFQAKYASEILGPWGTTRPTGVVSLTTGKKIEEIACGVPLTLDQRELRFLGVEKAKAAVGEASGSIADGDALTAELSPSLPAAAADAVAYPYSDAAPSGSVMSRFFRYIEGLF